MALMETRAKLHLTEERLGELECTVLAPLASGPPPRFCVILCHGFGAPGTDLVALGPDLAAMCPEHVGNVAYLFPQAPLDLGRMGMPGARAWWMIDIERFQRSIDNPEKMARFRRAVPEGMPESSRLLRGMLADVERQLGIATKRTLLAGFSQGSMVATDVALRLSERPAGLCVFSGTLIAQDEWQALAQKRGPLPVLQSHGNFDAILPFAGAEGLRDVLKAAGLDVEFLPFDGPHTIPYEALERLAHLMRRVFVERDGS
jgi:phospholipase/carboxylesterase